MMTFSFKPMRWSTLPLMAASVRTRVVSWKEAADRKESVAREALVMPMQDGGIGGLPQLGLAVGDAGANLLVGGEHLVLVGQGADQQAGVAGVVHADLAQHLPHDDFNMLIVDIHALHPVDTLDF